MEFHIPFKYVVGARATCVRDADDSLSSLSAVRLRLTLPKQQQQLPVLQVEHGSGARTTHQRPLDAVVVGLQFQVYPHPFDHGEIQRSFVSPGSCHRGLERQRLCTQACLWYVYRYTWIFLSRFSGKNNTINHRCACSVCVCGDDGDLLATCVCSSRFCTIIFLALTPTPPPPVLNCRCRCSSHNGRGGQHQDQCWGW